MIQIKHLDGTLVLELEIPEGASVHRELMGEHYMRMQFSLGEPVYLKLGDYVDTNFGRFELTSPYSPKYNTETDGYDYNLQLDAYYIKWKNKKCRYNPKNAASETSFHLTASVSVHLEVILSSINAIAAKDSNFKYSGKDFIYTLKGFDSANVNTAKYKQYQNTDILSALNDLANIFDCEWWVEDNIIFFGRCENESEPVSFEVNKNVASVTSSESKNEYATRVYAFGSTRNLPKDYRKDSSADITKNGIVQKRLMLPLADCPNGYLQDADVKDETSAVEAVVIDEDIYPRTKCKVSKVETYTSKVKDKDTGEEVEQTFYRLTDGSGLNFSTDFILEGETLHILFQSGKMNGMDFECEYNDEKKYYEVVVNEDYGRPLPDTSLHPEVGDDFVLYNWDATKIGNTGLVESAEKELKDAIQKKLDRKKVDPNTYTCKMISWWYEQNRKTSETAISHYAMGQKVSLINASSFDAPRSSRIIGYDIKLDIEYDAPEYLVGEATVYSQAQDLQSQIDSITVNGLSYTGNTGNGGGGQRIYIITSEDSSVESDVNVYSAARTKKQFADKIHNDDIYSLWSFAQSTNRRGVQTHHYKNEGNEDNLFGKGFELIQRTNEQGNSVSRLEVDELLVRMRAVFASLEIRQMSYVGGNFVFSSAGSKLYHVVPKGSVYRCYLYSDDGTTATANNWDIDDQALCQTFDIEEGVHQGVKNKRYWRRVVATGKEIISGKTNADGSADITQYQYIDLSKADCEMGSAVPEFGDTVVQFGNWTNKDRQGVIYIMVVGENAPAIIEYANVGEEHFVLPEADTQISPKGGNIFKGKFYSIAEGGKNPITIEDQIKNLINDFEALKNQADKKMEIWFKEGVPFPQKDNAHAPTEPANEWTTDALKELHVGDLYYDTLKQPSSTGGRAYRWYKEGGEYYWIEVTDQDTIAALEKIADVASDGVLSAGAEKTRVLLEWREAVDAYLKYSEQALDYIASVEKNNVDFDMRTPYESFCNAFNALASMMNDGEDYDLDDMPTPVLLQDINTSTKIDADNYRLRWSNWHEALVGVLNGISGAAQALANKAQETADGTAVTLVNMASDSIITAQEKVNLHMIWDDTCSEYENIINEWDNSSAQGSEREELVMIFNALTEIMDAIFDDMEGDSDLTGIKATYDDGEIDFSTAWAIFYEKYGYLREQIQLATNKDIEDIGDVAGSAFSMCDDMVSDGKLDPLEKIIIKREFNAAFMEKNTDETGLIDRAKDSDGNYIVDVTSYVSAFRAWGTYLNGGTNYIEVGSIENWNDNAFPLWLRKSEMNKSNKINGDTFRTLWGNFYEQRNLLITALANKAQETADNAQETADKKAQIFTSQPVPPYNVGDLWFVNEDVRKICLVGRKEGENFNESDWGDFIEEKEPVDKRNVLSQFGNVYHKNYGGMLQNGSSIKVYISTKEEILPEEVLFMGVACASMRTLYLATSRYEGVTSALTGWSVNVPQLSDSKKYLWCIVECKDEYNMTYYGKPQLLHTFRGRDKIVKVKPYYAIMQSLYGPNQWSEEPVMPIPQKPCLWTKFELEAMENDTYMNTLGNIKFNGETVCVNTSDTSGWARPLMITDQSHSLFITLKALQSVFGGITLTVYKMPQDSVKDYDLAIRTIKYTDTFFNKEQEGPCEILMYYNDAWELLQESVTAMIENLGNALRLVVFGAEGEYDFDASGLVTTKRFNELFSQKVTLDSNGNITNIDKSGFVTSSNFATMFSEALASDGTVVKKSEITAFVTKDANGYLQSGVKIKADAIEITGTDSISLLLNGVKSDLKNTGIDIQQGVIVLNADNTTINGNLSLKDPNQGILIYDQYGNTKVSIINNTIGNLANYDLGADRNVRTGKKINRTSTSQKINASLSVSLGTFTAGQSMRLHDVSVHCYKNDAPFDTNVSTITYSYEVKCGTNVVTTKSGTATRKTSGFDFDGFALADYTNNSLAYTGEYILNVSYEVTLASSSASMLGEFYADIRCLCRKVMAGIIQISTDGAMIANSNVSYNWFGSDKMQMRNGASAIRLINGRLQRNSHHASNPYWNEEFADISTMIPTNVVNALTYTATENDGLIIFSTVLGSTDGAQRTLTLPNPMNLTGKVYYIKNQVGNSTLLRTLGNGMFTPPDSANEVETYSCGNKSIMAISQGFNWILFYCG